MVQRPSTRDTNSRIRITTVAIALAVLLLSVLLALKTASLPVSSDTHSSDEIREIVATRSPLPRMLNPIKSLFANYWSKPVTTSSPPQAQAVDNSTSRNMAKRTPVYFVSHGGPQTMYDTKHPVWPQLQAIGREITQKVKPSAIIVFSAHWQAERSNTIEVNVSEDEPLLYDYYGFPRHYYSEKFPNKGSTEVAKKVIDALKENGIRTQEADRGLDHGVFVPFKVMFDPKENPVTVPIVQVSLFDDDTDAEAHIKLGRAVQKLREENIVIVASGMSVHNLRDLMMMGRGGRPITYGIDFDQAIKDAAETKPGPQRDELMVNLLKRSDARRAHPTFEHLLPIHVAIGASGEDQGQQLWTLVEGPAGWAQYRFGNVEVAS